VKLRGGVELLVDLREEAVIPPREDKVEVHLEGGIDGIDAADAIDARGHVDLGGIRGRRRVASEGARAQREEAGAANDRRHFRSVFWGFLLLSSCTTG
jgi:hypothetical protein